jgi:hypothetical protein
MRASPVVAASIPFSGEWGIMGHTSSRSVEVLRNILQQMERAADANDPVMAEVKRQIVRAIANLEIARQTSKDDLSFSSPSRS